MAPQITPLLVPVDPHRVPEYHPPTTARHGWWNPMRVDVTCKKCGERRRLEVGDPGSKPVEEFVHLITERLSHQPSFQCFGGHMELAPPLPRFWDIHWDTAGD